MEAVYSSPLSRAWETARIIAAPHGLAVVTEDDLREIDLGVWEGLTVAEITQRYGDVVARRRADPEGVVPAGGESLDDVQARAQRAMGEILSHHQDGSIAVVAHGAVNKMILLSALGAPPSAYWRIGQDNAAINVVDFGGAHPYVRVVNDTAHLSAITS